MAEYRLGLFSVEIDPENGKPTLSPSAVKGLVRDLVGKVKNTAGKSVDGKLDTPKGEVSVSVAVKSFLDWQIAEFPEAVAARQTGVGEALLEAASGKYHLDVAVNKANGSFRIIGQYTGKVENMATDLETLRATIRRCNATA